MVQGGTLKIAFPTLFSIATSKESFGGRGLGRFFGGR